MTVFIHKKNITSTTNNYSFNYGCTRQIFLMIEVLQMLHMAKTHAIPLGNHVTQQKLTETTENRSVLTETLIFGIFRFIPVYSTLFGCHSRSLQYHSCSFRFIHSGVIPASFRHIPVYSGIFRSVPVFSNTPYLSRTHFRNSRKIFKY